MDAKLNSTLNYKKIQNQYFFYFLGKVNNSLVKKSKSMKKIKVIHYI